MRSYYSNNVQLKGFNLVSCSGIRYKQFEIAAYLHEVLLFQSYGDYLVAQ